MPPVLLVIYAISFLDLFAVGIVYTLLFTHIRDLGGSHLVVGLCGTIYSGLQVLSGPLVGSWSDVRGKKEVLRITLAISCISYFILGLTNSIAVILFARIILGSVKQTQTLCKALVADLVPQELHAKTFGTQSTIGTTAFIVAPIVAGHISELPDGFFHAVSLAALLFVTNIALTLFLPNDQFTRVADEESVLMKVSQEFRKTVLNLREVNWKLHGNAFAIRFLYSLAISIYLSNHSLYVQEKFGLSKLYTGYTVSFLSALGVVGGLSLGYITEKFYSDDQDCSKRLLHFFTILTFLYILLCFASNVVIFVILLIPYGFTTLMLRIVSMEMTFGSSENDKNGSLTGVSNSFTSIARFISPVTSGVIGHFLGGEATVLSAAIPSVIAVLLCVRLRNVKKLKET